MTGDGVSASDVERFDGERPRLLGLAYRMLGSASDAEDVVQDAWLRWQTADRAKVEHPGRWLTTVTTRLAIDRIRAQQRRRETYVGPWLPEPVAVGAGPDEVAVLSDSLTLGFLTLLDTLAPQDRAMYLLAEVFSQPYARIASMVGRSDEACRQAVSRARRRLRHAVPAGASEQDRRAAEATVQDLLAAIAADDVGAALARVAPDAVLLSDGGPHRRAARRPVIGAERIVRLLANLYRRQDPQAVTIAPAWLNRSPGLTLRVDGELDTAMVFETDGAAVIRVWIIRNPDKLRHLTVPPGLV